jgi:hypothetical protein
MQMIARTTLLETGRFGSIGGPQNAFGEKSPMIANLLVAISAYASFPVFKIPLTDISLSLPLFSFFFLVVISTRQGKLSRGLGLWLGLALAIWMGSLISLIGNSLIDSASLQLLVMFGYWLTVFLLVNVVITRLSIGPKIMLAFAIGVSLTALSRWFEALVLGKWGPDKLMIMPRNTYGILFSTYTPMLLCVLVSKKYKGKPTPIIMSGLLISAIALNGSRGSWAGVIAGGLMFFLLYALSVKLRAVAVIAVSLILMASLTALVATSSKLTGLVESRADTIEHLDSDWSFAARQMVTKKAFLLFERNPWVGVGPSRFTKTRVELEIPLRLRGKPSSMLHSLSALNAYLGLLAETGIVGTLPYLILMLILIIMGFSAAVRLGSAGHLWAIGIYSGFIGLSVHFMGFTGLTNTGTWFIYGLVSGMIMIAHRMKKQSGLPHATGSHKSWKERFSNGSSPGFSLSPPRN